MLSRPSNNPHRYDNKTTVGKAFHKMSVMTNAIYLSREALLKKRDSNKAGSGLTFSFKELCQVRSWRQFISSPSAPMTVLIIILFMIMSTIGCYESYQWILRRNWQTPSEDPMELYKPINYDRKLMMEVEQVLVKAMQLDHKGSVKEYSVFLESTMEKYCMKSLEERGYKMDAFGNENFHLNLRGAIHFVGSGGYFEAHKMLAVTPSGSLIDPLDKDLNPDNRAQTCPLLTGLWEMALPNGNEKQSANRPKDDPRAFAARVLDYHVDEFYDLASRSLFRWDCWDMVMVMPKDILQNFLLNWFVHYHYFQSFEALNKSIYVNLIRIDMIQQSAMNFDKAHEEHKKLQYKDWVGYVINRYTGDILEATEFDEDVQWTCSGIQAALNAEWSFDDDPQQKFTIDAVREHIEQRFDEWYAEEVHPRLVASAHA